MPSHRPAFRSRAPLSREGEEAHRYIPADERVGFSQGAVAALLRARPEIIESTFDRVNIEFTTVFSYHIWWL